MAVIPCSAAEDPATEAVISRRRFVATSGRAALTGASLARLAAIGATVDGLPAGSEPAALDFPWFPSRLHAFVWRNWGLIPASRMGEVVGASGADIVRLGRSMGLTEPHDLDAQRRKRASLTIIRRNWHLLPYGQLIALLGWSADELAYTLREDDFFFVKLGLLKPKVAPLRWSEPDAAQTARAAEIAAWLREAFLDAPLEGRDPLFSFVDRLSRPPPHGNGHAAVEPLRLGYSYFALYGDPLLDPALDPYPDGYLARLADSGVNAVWLQGVLARLARVPWADEPGIAKRREALERLVARAGRHGIKVYLYLNEPRALPKGASAFARHPDWRGVGEQDFHALCTTPSEVRDALTAAVAEICRAAPRLGGFLTITGSENLTHCWSHGRGADCPRCAGRRPAEVVAELNTAFYRGIQAAGRGQRLLAWDWGWGDDWAVEAIEKLPAGVSLMSVSEWGLALDRGGVRSTIGEYCLSAIGPGPRAQRHWAAARKRGMRVVAKVQFGVSWEFAASPYLPVLDNVFRHAQALRTAGVDDLMLGWTLGGHPSPNIEAVAEAARGGSLDALAERRHGRVAGPAAAAFWRQCSDAYREFPFHPGTVYQAPLQTGPANPLWPSPTGYGSTMVGIPYDDLDGWRSVYPPEVFIAQLEKVADGFDRSLAALRATVPSPSPNLAEEMTFIEAAALHFASVAGQCRFVLARRAGDNIRMRDLARSEADRAIRLHALQSRDARLGFEASNQYFYTPLDLAEKVINCRWLAKARV
jgi:hypothetical protein